MSSRSQQQTAAVLADKKRQRREARIREHYDRISAALTNTDSTKFAARYPTRVIPDVPGIMELSAAEVKRDLKEADNHSEFRYYPPMDDEDTLLQAIGTIAHPPALEGSHIITKMQRLLSWQNNPALRAQDLELWQKKMLEASTKYHEFEQEQQEWYDAFEAGRKLFTSMLSLAQEQGQILSEDSRRLYRLCEEECLKGMIHNNSVHDAEDPSTTENHENGNHSKAHGGKKTKVTIRDMVDELARRQLEYVHGASDAEVGAKGNLPQSVSKKNITVVEVTDEAMETARKASSLGNTAGVSCVSDTAHVSSTHNHKHGAMRMVVKQEAQESVPHLDEMDLGDADSVYHDARNLQILLQQLKESIERSDMQQGDVDIFFQEREDNLSFLEHALLQHATGIPMEKRQAMTASAHGTAATTATSAMEHKALAAKTFEDLLHQPTRHWETFLSETLDAMEPSGLVTRKKKRNMDHLALNVFVRHRTERGRLLMYTPLSKLEDRYLACFPGTLPSIYATHRTGLRPEEIVNTRAQYVPPAIAQAEDDALERAYLQSDAAALNLHIKQLKQSIADLQRMQHESDLALQRAQMAQRHVTLEDHAEYVQSMVTFAEQGLIPQEALAALSTPETAAALAHYEALQQNAGINALLGVGGFGAGLGAAGGNGSGGAGLGVIGGSAKSGNKGGKQKKGGFGGQRQGSTGSVVSVASTFSALAALTAVTETAMLSSNTHTTGPSVGSDAALSTAVSTSSALETTEDDHGNSNINNNNNNNNNITAVEPVTSKTQPISRRNSRGVGLHAPPVEESSSAVIGETTEAAATTASTVSTTGGRSNNKGGRKSASSSSSVTTTSDSKDSDPSVVPAAVVLPASVTAAAAAASTASGSTARNAKGGRRSSLPPTDDDTTPTVDVSPPTTSSNNSNNKRKSDALATTTSTTTATNETNGTSSEQHETAVTQQPAAKRQRVGKK